MARYAGATWRGPVPNETPGGMTAYLGLVLHVEQGTEPGTDSWFHNPASQVSAHFGNPKSGGLDQWVDTKDRAWAEVDGNPEWISVENEGNSGDSLTPSQLENVAELLAWLHNVHGIPLQISNSPNTPGLSGHSIGGATWGDHLTCPGQPILNQRQAIINRAAAILGTTNNGGPTVGIISPVIGQTWPEIAGQFPANAPFDNDTALIWSDAGARAAALFAKEARDAINALAARIASTPTAAVAPPAIDVNALSAALAPHLAAGATADEIAQAVVAHLGAAPTAG